MQQLGVIFDMDGVLVDSYHAHFESWQRLYGELGIEYSEEQFAGDFGRTSRDILRRTMGDDLRDEQVVAWDGRKEEIYRELLRESFPAMDGAAELIQSLAADGFRLGDRILRTAGKRSPGDRTIGGRRPFRCDRDRRGCNPREARPAGIFDRRRTTAIAAGSMCRGGGCGPRNHRRQAGRHDGHWTDGHPGT